MKRTVLWILTIMTLLGTMAARADAKVGLNVDWNKFKDSSRGDWGLGGRIAFGAAGLDFTTGFDYYFVDAGSFFKNPVPNNAFDLKFWELMENVTYTLPTGSVKPYFGGGIDYSRRTFNDAFSNFFGDTKNRVGFNALGGLKFGSGVQPFVEARGTFYNGTAFSNRFIITGGILF